MLDIQGGVQDSRFTLAMRVDVRCLGFYDSTVLLLLYVSAVYLMSLRFLRLLAARRLDVSTVSVVFTVSTAL